MKFAEEELKKYESSEKAGALRQGEILSKVEQFTATTSSENVNAQTLKRITHAYALIVTPDCDLEWDYQARQNNATQFKIVPNVLLCILLTASELAKRINSDKTASKRFEDSTIWKRITQNNEERFHFLEKIDAAADLQAKGTPLSLCVDFKDFFTVPTEDLYEKINEGRSLRRCRLISPYREHFNNRFTYFQSRIALPEDHRYNRGEIQVKETNDVQQRVSD